MTYDNKTSLTYFHFQITVITVQNWMSINTRVAWSMIVTTAISIQDNWRFHAKICKRFFSILLHGLVYDKVLVRFRFCNEIFVCVKVGS